MVLSLDTRDAPRAAVKHLPRDLGRNGWLRGLPPRALTPPLTGDVVADWAIIGAGYSGLAAARRLAELRPADRIAVIDAGIVGENASGRNSGFAIDLPHNVTASLEELKAAKRHCRLSRFAISRLEGLIHAYGIDCDWTRPGRYHAAASEDGIATVLRPYTEVLRSLDEAHEWVEGDALADRLGTRCYRAAVFTPGTALMNPAALIRGLADALPDQVQLYEQSPVTHAQLEPKICLETPGGRVRADKLILATNGFAEQFGFYPGRFLHLVVLASLTAPIDQGKLMAAGLSGSWGLTPAHAMVGATLRLTEDRRLLVRQLVRVSPSMGHDGADLEDAKIRHRAAIEARFPQLGPIEMGETWGGMVCISRNGAPGFGEVRPGVWTAVCHNGSGITKGTYCGHLIAELASGHRSDLLEDVLSLGGPSLLPHPTISRLGARMRFMWEGWRHRKEA